MTDPLAARLFAAAKWADRQDEPSPDWDDLLDEAARRIDADRTRIANLTAALDRTVEDLDHAVDLARLDHPKYHDTIDRGRAILETYGGRP